MSFAVVFLYFSNSRNHVGNADKVSIKMSTPVTVGSRVEMDYRVVGDIPKGFKILVFSGLDRAATATFGRATDVESGLLRSYYSGQFDRSSEFVFYFACVKDDSKSTDHYIQVLSSPESIEACGGSEDYFVCRPDRLGYYLYNNIDVAFDIVRMNIQQNVEPPLFTVDCK